MRITREDFKKLCQANAGRWMGEITLVADFPGFGKKGEKLTCYAETRIVDDGNALLTRFYGGTGSSTGLATYDARAKRIRSFASDSAGGFNRSIVYLKDGKWTDQAKGSMPDGTEVTSKSVSTFSPDGNSVTIEGSMTIGGKKTDDARDTFRRVGK